MSKSLAAALQKISEMAYAVADTEDEQFNLLVEIRDAAQDGMKGWSVEKRDRDVAEIERLKAELAAKGKSIDA